MRGRWIRPWILLMAALALDACSVFSKAPPKTALREIQVIAEVEANQNSATALDLVFVYDNSVVALLPKTGPAWFETKAALLSGNPQALETMSLQVPPSITVAPMKVSGRRRDAIRVLAYANYLAEAGQSPLDLTAFKRAAIRLQAKGVKVSESN
ncbi:MAG: hypothetical protein HY308_02940 [Gammaproteobacteria bacterium]|nr:hypothetical protein [Gammaproteobacteria bacterium]